MELTAPRLDLAGLRVLVTGAGRGLGLGLATAMAGWGARVGVADLNKTVPDFAAWSGIMDVTDEAAVEASVSACWDALGGIDLLVNNAGVLSVFGVVDMAATEWRRVMEVNATGTFLVSQAVVRRMIAEARGGSIVSISSIAGKRGDPTLAHYSASKFAVIGFTQALAREVGRHGIRVNAVCPGVVETAMIDDLTQGSGTSVSEWLRHQALPRSQTPEEIAWVVASLHGATAVTGQAINVDGGTLFD
jgi:meso-butanediol dehydrogenase/(S,S)-butanediol dehydrogenase/diacetyl reductase